MKRLYTFICYLILPFATAFLLWKYREDKSFRARLGELFGCFSAPESTGGIWVHAASLGEVNASAPLVKQLQVSFPQTPLTITTQTNTGSHQVKKLFGETVFHVYAPFDVPDAINRFLNRIRPCCHLILETELWPNRIAACASRDIPIIIANARLSEKSMRHLPWFGPLLRDMLEQINCVIAQSPQDQQRYLKLGVASEKLSLAGNTKYDLQVPDTLLSRANDLRQSFGKNRPVFIAGSTHEGEETIVLAAYSKIKSTFTDSLLILAPRHPQRFKVVVDLCRASHFTVAQRSENSDIAPADILVLDSMGELLQFYATADCAFVGGTLVPIGGHNLLEPIVVGTPVITGPHDATVVDIRKGLVKHGLCATVTDATTLAAAVMQHFQRKGQASQQQSKASEFLETHKGAVAKHMETIEHFIR